MVTLSLVLLAAESYYLLVGSAGVKIKPTDHGQHEEYDENCNSAHDAFVPHTLAP